MKTLIVLHCLVTFRQFLALILYVLGIVVSETSATSYAGGGGASASASISRNGGGGGGASGAAADYGHTTFSDSGFGKTSGFSSSGYGDPSLYYGNNHTDKPLLNPTVYQIGGVLSNNKSISSFNETISVSSTQHPLVHNMSNWKHFPKPP